MPPIVTGQTFPSLLDFKNALRQWAIEANWTPHILDSDSHRVRAGCRSTPDCPFRIRANYSNKRGDARVTTVQDVHNCDPLNGEGPSQRTHQKIHRAETGKLKFLVNVVPTLMTVKLDTTIHEIIAVVEEKFGQKIPTRQAQKVKSALVTRVKGPCRHCHRMGHTRRLCPQLKESATGPIEFSQNDTTMDFSRNTNGENDYSQTMDDDTFGDGGMSYDGTTEHYNHNHDPPDNVDPGLENGIEPEYAPPSIPPRAPLPPPTTSNAPLTLQAPRAPFPHQMGLPPLSANPHDPGHNGMSPIRPSAQTNAEKQAEAISLLEEAHSLMAQATQMSDKAKQILRSIGHGP